LTNSSADRPTLPLGIVNGSAITNTADPVTTPSKPSGRVTTRSTNISEPDGDAVWADSGDDAIVSATANALNQRLVRSVMKGFRQSVSDHRILANCGVDAKKIPPQRCGSSSAAAG